MNAMVKVLEKVKEKGVRAVYVFGNESEGDLYRWEGNVDEICEDEDTVLLDTDGFVAAIRISSLKGVAELPKNASTFTPKFELKPTPKPLETKISKFDDAREEGE